MWKRVFSEILAIPRSIAGIVAHGLKEQLLAAAFILSCSAGWQREGQRQASWEDFPWLLADSGAVQILLGYSACAECLGASVQNESL